MEKRGRDVLYSFLAASFGCSPHGRENPGLSLLIGNQKNEASESHKSLEGRTRRMPQTLDFFVGGLLLEWPFLGKLSLRNTGVFSAKRWYERTSDGDSLNPLLYSVFKHHTSNQLDPDAADLLVQASFSCAVPISWKNRRQHALRDRR
jgi:hypothetical protein